MIVPEQVWYIKKNKSVYNRDTKEYSDNIIDLSYVTYYEENNAFEKRKTTGIDWSRNSKDAQQIIKNELLSGYQIQQEVSRWSTSNVVWRVLDPRGFEFEIYSGNMMALLENTTITNSVIMSKCILGFESGKVILLPEDSEPYKNALLETKINKGEFQLDIGSIYKEIDNDVELQYLGEFYSIIKTTSKSQNGDRLKDLILTIKVSNKKQHFFRIISVVDSYRRETNMVLFSDKPKVSKIRVGFIDYNVNDYINTHKKHNFSFLSCIDIISITDDKNPIKID